ncbi:MAG: saccharopine dehydrogenase NADP-binding domain-containing protein [Dokdonella sp.]
MPVARPPFRVLILGGYGQFGARIAAALARDNGMHLVIGGRRLDAGERLLETLRQAGASATMGACAIDLDAVDFTAQLAVIAPQLVIHAAGPFQGRDYRVAEATLAAGAHYVDLADAREFVTGIEALAAQARRANRWVISGASSVPGLSAAVVEAFASRLSALESIEVAISPGNRTDRGVATTRAILSYVGKPFPILQQGHRTHAHGWQSLRRLRVAGVGARWLARCEVPDLSLLPQRYPQLLNCDFRAGLELRRMHFGLWLASWLVRARLIASLEHWSRPLLALSRRWQNAGSDTGLMCVDMRGIDDNGHRLHLRWTLVAADGDGPQVPATAAVVLARKLARGKLHGAGAQACLDLFTLDEFLHALRGHAITTTLEIDPS